MRWKYKLGITASGVALAASTIFAFAGSASASDNIFLCVKYPSNDEYCVLTTDINMDSPTIYSSPGGIRFDAPTSGKGQISTASGTKLCIEIDAKLGDKIEMEACDAHAAEEWWVTVGSVSFGSRSESSYIYSSDYDSSLCLASPTTKAGPLVVANCNDSSPYQNWLQNEIN